MNGELELPNIQIYPDIENLAHAAADLFTRFASEAIEVQGVFSVALSGGSTPQSLFKILAAKPYTMRIDWSKVHLFWGDERCVPPEHPDSNYFHAQNILIAKIDIPKTNVHRIPTEFPPEQAARQYEETLVNYFSSPASQTEHQNAGFDLVLLGMGDDGHTASLFPGTPAVREEKRWVAPVYVEKLNAWRITLTPALLNCSTRVAFLVSGSGKSSTLQKVIYGTFQPDRYPAQVIRPGGEEPLWLVDEAAAALIQDSH
jgi:6-phosphogluconolactonase